MADSFAAAMSFDMQADLATMRLNMELLPEIAAHSLKHQYDMEPLLRTVMDASARRTAACDAATSAARAYQRARGNTAKVAAAATELLRAHGRRREYAAELRKAAAALGIAAEAAVADADAAAAVKQCLEIHCIDKAALSQHEQACEDCRQLYAQLLQLCSKLGLSAPPGAPAAAAAAAAASAAESAAAPEDGPVQIPAEWWPAPVVNPIAQMAAALIAMVQLQQGTERGRGQRCFGRHLSSGLVPELRSR